MSYPYIGDVINQVLGVQWTVPIPMFGTFVAASILVGIYLAKKEVIRFEGLGLLSTANVSVKAGEQASRIPVHETVTDLGLIVAFAGIVGARVFHILEYPEQLLEDPIEMIFSRGGFTIYGGMLFGVVAGIIYLKKRDVPIVPMLDALAPAMILGYGIGRIGCQVSGDGDWGIAADLALKPDWLPAWLWAQTYENNVLGVVIQSPGVYPTPLYEVIMAVGIFSMLWLLRRRPYKAGQLFSIYLLLSGIERLLIEQIRVNSKYDVFGLVFTQAELISLFLIMFGLAGIMLSIRSTVYSFPVARDVDKVRHES